ncbi:hypothetical protein KNE206_30680 [Kitasatospora sp. NE20-6]|uniref:helix-turn-helix domain-containing protein n=1 Tax=Kitasatospora sp. NE20-6 TaxID=2859066 RepID=UPI0034DBDCE5
MSGSGRPERRLDRNASPLAAFACDLRLVREQAKLTYRQMSSKAGYSHNALAQAAGGARFPSLELSLAFARACGGDEREWKQRWYDAKEAIEREQKRPAAVREPDRWPDLDENTAEGRLAAYLRQLYLVHERPVDIVAGEIGHGAEAVRRWLDGVSVPLLEDLLSLLQALHAPPGPVVIARRLHKEACTPTGNQRLQVSVRIGWRGRSWSKTLIAPDRRTVVR